MALNLKAIIVVAICSFVCVAAQSTDKNAQCVSDLIQWCGSMKKSTNFVGNFLTTDYSSSGERQIVHCIAGRGGTNCTLNNTPWFACRPDGSVTYRNNVLQENTSVSDGGVCDAAAKASNIFNMNYDSAEVRAAINAGRKQYEKAMSNMHHTLGNVHRTLSRPCFPFCDGNPFPSGFPFNG